MKTVMINSGGIFGTNCYLVISDSGNAALIDAPRGGERILAEAEKNGASIKKILLTHGHCDHIESLAFLAKETGAEVYIHEMDEKKLSDDYLDLSEYFSDYYDKPVEHFSGAKKVSDGDIITLDELSFKVLHTPGHTSGSVCYICDEAMFSGDTLFKMSAGRTDMPDGNSIKLNESLKMLDNLGKDYVLLSGHGDRSTLSNERKFNPFMKGFDYDDMF